jgi:hypothetical protein
MTQSGRHAAPHQPVFKYAAARFPISFHREYAPKKPREEK